eukprot:6171999-Pleurochrysis_carterae.AAC.1
MNTAAGATDRPTDHATSRDGADAHAHHASRRDGSDSTFGNTKLCVEQHRPADSDTSHGQPIRVVKDSGRGHIELRQSTKVYSTTHAARLPTLAALSQSRLKATMDMPGINRCQHMQIAAFSDGRCLTAGQSNCEVRLEKCGGSHRNWQTWSMQMLHEEAKEESPMIGLVSARKGHSVRRACK